MHFALVLTTNHVGDIRRKRLSASRQSAEPSANVKCLLQAAAVPMPYAADGKWLRLKFICCHVRALTTALYSHVFIGLNMPSRLMDLTASVGAAERPGPGRMSLQPIKLET